MQTTMVSQKTTVAKAGQVPQKWYLVDAEGQTVGRMATRLATILMGKHKPTYTPHVDCGDFIVVINCEKVVFTGQKWDQKLYRHHTGYIGGLVEEKASRLLRRFPDRVLRQAVRRMLPKTKLGRKMLKKLKIYAGTDHPHGAQGPEALEINARRA